MGCDFSRITKNAESLIQEAERRLLLSDIPASSSFAAFSKYESKEQQEVLFKSDILEALKELSQDTDFESDPSSARNIFYNNVMESPCSLKKIRCLCILLGQDRTRRKAFLLFKNYDLNDDRRLNRDEITEMINDVIDISNDKLPKLAKFIFDSESKSLYNYLLKINDIKHEKMIEYICNLLTGNEDSVTRDDFIYMMTAKHFRSLYSSHLFRYYGLKFKPQ